MHKLLLTELRTLVEEVSPINESKASTEVSNPVEEFSKHVSIDSFNYEKAFVDVDNLRALGYNLKEGDILKLAKSYSLNDEMTPLYKRVQRLIPQIKASPMYPNFPIQVIEMDEVEFRVHQLVHYLTTYGLEDKYGIEVSKGWTPSTEEIMEREEDVHLKELVILDYISPNEVNDLVIDKLISKRERLLEGELELAKSVVSNEDRKLILDIPFKENIGAIYSEFLLNGSLDLRYHLLNELKFILKHPGDVLDLIESLVVMNKYKHLKTSLKRGLVNLIESYPLDSIEENLASHRWSNRFLGKRGKSRAINRNIALIDYLSYSKFSKDKGAMKLVNELKDGSLLSWNQRLERSYEIKDMNNVLDLLKQRPGVYFRQINRLYSQGVNVPQLSTDVKEFAHELKTQSIVSALNNFTGDSNVVKVFYDALIHNLMSKEIESIAGKNVFVDKTNVDLNESKISIIDKFAEGGYIQNGMAIKIPEDAKYVRFFTYWNDRNRIDIDLHAAYSMTGDKFGHIGWNGSHKDDGLVYSGDIVHSDAAEYIDINLDEAYEVGVDRVQFNINSYTKIPFKNIDTIFSGLMLMGEMGQHVELYDEKNVLFRHDLNNNSMAANYGLLDIEKRLIYILGTNTHHHNDKDLVDGVDVKLSISDYLSILLATQGSNLVAERDDADLVIGLEKSDEENYLSLIDENFFMD